MGDFRVTPSSLFDERPDVGTPDARKRKKPRHPGAEQEPEDAVELSSEHAPEAEPEEPAQDFFSPSEKSEEES
jgi:hypothetical protein